MSHFKLAFIFTNSFGGTAKLYLMILYINMFLYVYCVKQVDETYMYQLQFLAHQKYKLSKKIYHCVYYDCPQ